MLFEGKLAELEQNAQALVRESHGYREVLETEVRAIQSQVGWIGRIGQSVSAASPLFSVGSALLGFLAVRKSGAIMRWIPTALTVWRVAREFLPSGKTAR